jgi:RimJ/RimL family protein N-acetyltransferase
VARGEVTVDMIQPTFETTRLTLRPMRAADRDAVIRVFADPESSRYLTRDMSDPVTAAASFERWLGVEASGGTGTWVMDLNGVAIGVGRLSESNRLPGKVVEVGWFVARTHVGHGYATEALRALVDHGLRALGLPALWAMIYEDNEPSLRLARGLGFVRVAESHQPAGSAQVHVLLPDKVGFGDPQPTLRTERLVMRPLREGDRDDVRAVLEDSGFARFLGSDLTQPGWVDRMFDRRMAFDGPAGMGHWAFVEDDIVVGLGHLRPSSELPAGVAEIGWYLGRDHQGRGLATEAATALRDHGLYTLKVPAVWALVHERNEASNRLAKRLGFLDVGTGLHYGAPHRVHVALPRTAAR